MDDANTNWTFHTDLQRKVLYIDFQALGGNMSKMLLLDAQQNIMLEDDQLFDLPSNTIYEVDLADLAAGTYTLELHTYNSIIKEVINVE